MIINAFAAVAHFKNEPAADLVETALATSNALLMSSVTLAECCLVLCQGGHDARRGADRDRGRPHRDRAGRRCPGRSRRRGEARQKYPIRFGNAFVYALAKARNLSVLTLDAEFAKTDADLVPLA